MPHQENKFDIFSGIYGLNIVKSDIKAVAYIAELLSFFPRPHTKYDNQSR